MGFTSYFFLFVFLPITSIIWIFVSRCKSAVVQNIYLILISLFFYFWAGADSIIVFISIILAAYLFGHLIYFAFGGSTIILLLENGCLAPEGVLADALEEAGAEHSVEKGARLGMLR